MTNKTKIIAVINQKGGVGKSTVAFHLAHEAAKKKKRVLCVDLDSQGTLSRYLTGDLDINKKVKGGVGAFLEGKKVVPMKTTHPGIDLFHGNKALDKYDSDPQVEERGFGGELRAALNALDYDYVIVDTPPAVGFRHLVSLAWADVAVIPMEPVMAAIVGFQDVIETINQDILPLNPSLRWFGVVNRANMRVKSHRLKDDWLREEYPKKILATFTSRSSVSDAMEEEPAQPVWLRRGAPSDLRDSWQSFCKRVIAA